MTPINSISPNRIPPKSNVSFKKSFSLSESKNLYFKNLKSQINPANFKLNSAQIMQADEYINKNYRALVEKGDIGEIVKAEKKKIENMRINFRPTREVKYAEKRLNYFKAKFGTK